MNNTVIFVCFSVVSMVVALETKDTLNLVSKDVSVFNRIKRCLGGLRLSFNIGGFVPTAATASTAPTAPTIAPLVYRPLFGYPRQNDPLYGQLLVAKKYQQQALYDRLLILYCSNPVNKNTVACFSTTATPTATTTTTKTTTTASTTTLVP